METLTNFFFGPLLFLSVSPTSITLNMIIINWWWRVLLLCLAAAFAHSTYSNQFIYINTIEIYIYIAAMKWISAVSITTTAKSKEKENNVSNRLSIRFGVVCIVLLNSPRSIHIRRSIDMCMCKYNGLCIFSTSFDWIVWNVYCCRWVRAHCKWENNFMAWIKRKFDMFLSTQGICFFFRIAV